jgi:hypothetical protein
MESGRPLGAPGWPLVFASATGFDSVATSWGHIGPGPHFERVAGTHLTTTITQTLSTSPDQETSTWTKLATRRGDPPPTALLCGHWAARSALSTIATNRVPLRQDGAITCAAHLPVQFDPRARRARRNPVGSPCRRPNESARHLEFRRRQGRLGTDALARATRGSWRATRASCLSGALRATVAAPPPPVAACTQPCTLGPELGERGDSAGRKVEV